MKKLAYGLIAIAGFSFWFFIGFPFGHHNESYLWAVHLKSLALSDAILHKMVPVANHRPLGQAVIWLTYKLSGGSIVPAQVFNYVVGVAAWLVMVFALKERKVFSALAMVVGGIFFSGYIYMFHLHGAFYSPLLLLVGLFFLLFEGPFSSRKYIWAAGAAFLISLFHPYALLFFIGGTVGLYLEQRSTITRANVWLLLASLLVALVGVKILVFAPGNDVVIPVWRMIAGFVSSYAMVEVNLAVSCVAGLLSVLTALSIDMAKPLKLSLILATGALSVACVVAGFPVLLCWVAICMLKMVMLRKWWILFYIIVAAGIPAITPSGSPTYTLFVIMGCTAAVGYGWQRLENMLDFLRPRVGVALIVACVGLSVVLRQGVRVPFLSQLVTPMIAEREKTIQLEEIIQWALTSDHRNDELVFAQDALNPSDAADAIDRRHRPPTSQEYLDAYLDSIRGENVNEVAHKGRLTIRFGDVATSFPGALYVNDRPFAHTAVVEPSVR